MSSLLGLLGLVLDPAVLVGLTCSPLTVVGGALGSTWYVVDKDVIVAGVLDLWLVAPSNPSAAPTTTSTASSTSAARPSPCSKWVYLHRGVFRSKLYAFLSLPSLAAMDLICRVTFLQFSG